MSNVFSFNTLTKQKLIGALRDCVKSLEGYRNHLNDGQPCDAEKNAVRLLQQLAKETYGTDPD